MGFIDNTLVSKRIRLLTLAVLLGFMATASVLIANEIAHKAVEETKDASLELASETAEINRLAFEAQVVASSFLITQNFSFAQEYREFTDTLKQNLVLFSESELVVDYPPLSAAGREVSNKLEAYVQHMQNLFAKWDRAGLSESAGLHGEIRDEAHAIEAIVETLDTELEATLKGKILLLTIRRAEKDYIQRLDLKYVEKIRETVVQFDQLIENNYSQTTHQAIHAHLVKYEQAFETFAEIRNGIFQDEINMRQGASDFVSSIESLRKATRLHLEAYNIETAEIRTLFFYIAFATVFLTALFVVGLANQISKSISGPLKKLTDVMQSFLRNDYTVNIPNFPTNTEFGAISAVLVKMREQDAAKIKAEADLQKAYNSLDERVKERTEELESANEELSQFAYVISHDIKAPLRAIHNYSDFLAEDLEGKLEEEQQGYLTSMSKAVAEGEQMIEDVLTLSRIGRADTEIQVVEIADILSSVKNLLALKEGCEFICSGNWPPVPANGLLLKQILTNLVVNGFKFNKSENKRVEISGGEKPGKGEDTLKHVEIRVCDNGIGIDEKYRENIFKIFHRLHTKKEYDGTGVGLAIVKKAMLELRGNVEIEDVEGGGTCFVLSLPLELDMRGKTDE